MSMTEAQFAEAKQALIELIVWYRDEWHRRDFCHSEMIEKIEQLNTEKELAIYEQLIDGWLD